VAVTAILTSHRDPGAFLMRDYPHFAAIATRQRAPSTPAGTMIAVNLGRIAWVVTVLACLVTAGILLLQGYYGYAGVTLAVAVSAAINLT
jgi:hypothetical protein